jgi:transcription antitermination factor NusA-like protein
VVAVEHLGDNMVIQRIGNKNIDVIEYEELKKLASQGISDEEIENVVQDYEEQENQIDAVKSFEVKREEYKRERAKENFKSGSGSFRRG